MFGDIIQPSHLIFVLAVALLVLGPKRLPEVGRSLGKGIRDFRGAMAGLEEHTSGLLKDDAPTPARTSPVDPVASASPVFIPRDDAAAEPEPSEYAD